MKTALKFALIAALIAAFLFIFVYSVSAADQITMNTKCFLEGARIYQRTHANNDIIKTLSRDEIILLAAFDGYVDGTVELGGGVMFDIKDDVSLAVYRETVSKLVLNHPDEWYKGRSYLCVKALMTAFPMPKAKEAPAKDPKVKELLL
jgi:hypothetical protein